MCKNKCVYSILAVQFFQNNYRWLFPNWTFQEWSPWCKFDVLKKTISSCFRSVALCWRVRENWQHTVRNITKVTVPSCVRTAANISPFHEDSSSTASSSISSRATSSVSIVGNPSSTSSSWITTRATTTRERNIDVKSVTSLWVRAMLLTAIVSHTIPITDTRVTSVGSIVVMAVI